MAFAAGGAYWCFAPKLPSAETLRDVRLQVPLRVYTRDDKFLAEFGEKRRTPPTRFRSGSSRYSSRARTTDSSSTPGSTGRA